MFSRFFSIFLLLLGLVSCSSEQEMLPTIRVGYAPHDHHAALYVAAQLPAYFRQHGGLYLEEIKFKQHYRLIDQGKPIAEVKLHVSTGGGQLIRKLSEKQLDLALGGVPAMIRQIDLGSRLKIVAPLMSDGAALVMAKPLELSDWPTFVELVKKSERPLRIGYKIDYSVQQLIFEQALTAERISFARSSQADADAQLLTYNLHGPQNLIPAVKNGLIDGFVIMQPFVALAEEQQVGTAVAQLAEMPPEGKWAGQPCCAVGANGPMLSRQRDVLGKMVALLLKANGYLQSHKDEGAQLVSNWLGKPYEVEKRSLPTINFLVDYPAEWHRGISFWLDALRQDGHLQGDVHSAAQKGEIDALLYDMAVYRQARKLADEQ